MPLDYSRPSDLRALAAFTPEEQGRSAAFEASPSNRAELADELSRQRARFGQMNPAERAAFADLEREAAGGAAPAGAASGAPTAGIMDRARAAQSAAAQSEPPTSYLSRWDNYFANLQPPTPPPPETTLLDRAKDVGLAGLQGAIGVPQAAVGIADLFTGGNVGKFLEDHAGFNPEVAQQILEKYKSPAALAAKAKVQASFAGEEGDDQEFIARIGRGAWTALQNPSVISDSIWQSLPGMMAGGLVARGALWASIPAVQRAAIAVLPEAQKAAAIASAARLSGPIAAAGGEGFITAGQQAEQIRTDEHNPSRLLDSNQALLAGGSGIVTAAIGASLGRIAQKLGFETPENLIAGVRADPIKNIGLIRRVVGGGLTEASQEFLQSAQEQMAQNLATGQDVWKDVDQAAVLGALSGAAMGVGSQAFHRSGDDDAHFASALARVGAAKTVDQAIAAATEAAESTPVLMPGNPAGTPGSPLAGPPVSLMGLAALRQRALAPATEPTPEMADRILTLREQLDAPGVRQGIEERLGKQALLEAIGAVQAADRIGDRALPDRTRELLLSQAEAKVRAALMTPEGSSVEKSPMTVGTEIDPVQAYVNTQRRTNTPAARAFLGEFEAGRITEQDVRDTIAREARAKPSEADIRIQNAADQAPKPPPGGGAGLVDTQGKPLTTAGTAGTAPSVIDENAHEAAVSPQNDKVATREQILGGNAELGHDNTTFPGLDLSVENPQGSIRKDLKNVPPKWENKMAHHYGYIKGTVGHDKDHVDVFVKPGTPVGHTGAVYVVDQYHDNGKGAFDEVKAMLGFASKEEAMQAYQSNYAKDWKGGQAITEMSADEFKAWVFNPATSTKPAQPLRERIQEKQDGGTRTDGPGTDANAPIAQEGRAGAQTEEDAQAQAEDRGRTGEVGLPADQVDTEAENNPLRDKINLMKRIAVLRSLRECLNG